jgi:hypothetical protein
MPRNERVSIEADGTDILPNSRARSAPPMKGRHEKFQFGQSPMAMTPFEKSRVALEVEERKMATEKYIKGIQGNDGGCFPDSQTRDDDLTTPLNVKSTY